MTDSMGPGKLVRHMHNLSYTYDVCLICIGLGPSKSSVICKNLSYSGSSNPSSPVYIQSHNCDSISECPVLMVMVVKFQAILNLKAIVDCIQTNLEMRTT